MEEIAFRQWSNLGFMCCRVAILIGNCDNCHAKSLDPGSEKIFGEAFQQEYARQATLKDKNSNGSVDNGAARNASRIVSKRAVAVR
jgi:hypothetical protein